MNQIHDASQKSIDQTQISSQILIYLFVVILLFWFKKYLNGGTYNPSSDLKLQQKVAIITGGSSGIGAQTVKQLAMLNCYVIIADRDQQKAEILIKNVRQKNPKAKVDFFFVDLANKQSIESFAKNINFEKIDFLVNNAGRMALPQKTLTKQGFEMQWGVNHMGHFYLTYLLWPKISKSQNFRVVNISSVSHKNVLMFGKQTSLDFDNMNFETGYQPHLAYSRSKLYNVLFTKALASRVGNRGKVLAVHPGIVRTDIMRDMTTGSLTARCRGLGLALIYPIFMFFTKNCFQGSQTTIFCLLSDDVQNGGYYADCKKDSTNPLVLQGNWERLWNISQEKWKIKFNP